jgi:cytosine-specific methyltransferase
MNAISLFSCGGIGDLALTASGFNVLVANELLQDRACVFKANYPDVSMIIGDIREQKENILNELKKRLNGSKLDIVFATPPCQGMSKNGRGKLLNLLRQGLRPPIDDRNMLIIPAVDIFLKSGAHTLVMENVPEMQNTIIPHPDNSENIINIIDYISEKLGNKFIRFTQIIEFADYGVPQSRQRLISIFSSHEKIIRELAKFKTLLPAPTHSNNPTIFQNRWVSVRDIISNLPPLDAKTKNSAKCEEIPFHRVPLLDEEKYLWVQNTQPEKSAFDNQCINPECLYQGNPTHKATRNKDGINQASTQTPLYCIKCNHLLPRPWVKENGSYRLMKGYTSAYKRMGWDTPASTLTQNLSYACSDNKLHPEQNRVLSLYEAMLLHTINEYEFKWERSDKKKVSDKLIRELIGESIPPKGLEIIFKHLAKIISKD